MEHGVNKEAVSWRLQQPLAGIISCIIMLAVFMVLWRVIMDPTGPVRWYSPLFGVIFLAGMIAVVVWHTTTFQFWPFSTETLDRWHPVARGIVLTAFSFGIVLVLYLVFTYVIGMLGITYFSSVTLTRQGIGGVIAREQSALAIVSFFVLVLIMSLVFKNAFEHRLWREQSQPAQGFSVIAFSAMLAVIAFAIFIHPHFGVLYLPWQEYTAAYPWWQPLTQTLHGNFSIGLIMSYLVVIFLSGTIWENKPWDLAKSQPARGLLTIGGTLLIAAIFFLSFLFINELRWGAPVAGAFRLQSINWRFLHAGEMTFFLVVPAAVLYFYFDNWPSKYSTAVNWAIRTAITIVGGVIVYWLYYAWGPGILNIVRGYADPDQFPIASLMLILMLILVHSHYFNKWPLGIKKRGA